MQLAPNNRAQPLLITRHILTKVDTIGLLQRTDQGHQRWVERMRMTLRADIARRGKPRRQRA